MPPDAAKKSQTVEILLGSEVWRTRVERERACVRAGGWKEASEALDACGGGEDAREIVLMYWCGKERLISKERVCTVSAFARIQSGDT